MNKSPETFDNTQGPGQISPGQREDASCSDSYLQKKYMDILQNISEGYYETDIQGNLEFFNESLCRILGYHTIDLAGMNYRTFTIGDDHHRVFETFNSVYTSGKGVELFEWNIKRKDGKIRHVEASAFPIINAPGIITGFRGIIKDVTKRKMAEDALKKRDEEYRHLVENSSMIIFSTDTDLNVTSVNPVIQHKLGFIEEDMKGNSIRDILYRDPADINNIISGTFTQHVEEVLLHNGKDVRFKAVCRHKYLNEPVTLQFKIDPIVTDNTITGIIGFASYPSEDPLQEYASEYHAVYEIENKLTIVEEISHRLTRDLFRHLSVDQVNMVRLGLRETIINAIEHGNFEITFDEKSEAKYFSAYINLIAERRMLPGHAGKKVFIDYHLTPERVRYIIRDQGNGFSYNDFLNTTQQKTDEIPIHHGRGIALTLKSFDTVHYNDQGNEVTLIKFFNT
ncbi:MAG TPA: PAS domain S-box protein [Spirochaetota bacterium]|nr:PAS domain S-box protein [Spirochaetota bacterium]